MLSTDESMNATTLLRCGGASLLGEYNFLHQRNWVTMSPAAISLSTLHRPIYKQLHFLFHSPTCVSVPCNNNKKG